MSAVLVVFFDLQQKDGPGSRPEQDLLSIYEIMSVSCLQVCLEGCGAVEAQAG